MVAAGDTVVVRSGSYSGDIRFRISGTATLPITFKAYPGENPIIDLTYDFNSSDLFFKKIQEEKKRFKAISSFIIEFSLMKSNKLDEKKYRE